MNQKELRRLSRSDLLEMMLSLSKENEHLRKELHQVKSKLEDRTIAMDSSGSLAEAALNLNGVFQAAQAACDQYKANIQSRADALLAQAQEKLEAADAQAEGILAQARIQAKQILDEAQQRMNAREDKYSWITDLMEDSEET
jgi:cell division septum initiation protein DivIVA